MRERCHNCDRPKAMKEDFDRDDREGDDGLCWGGMYPKVDWRARALAAEERLTMIQQGDRVDVLGGGVVVSVYGPASKRVARVKADRGDHVEAECAKCTVLPPAFKVGDWVEGRLAGHAGKCVFQIAEIAQVGQTTWTLRGESATGAMIVAYSRDCTLATPPVEVKVGSEMRPIGVTVGGRRYTVLMRENPDDPIARFKGMIADAETCVLDGAATEQAKCIASLAKALRESQASCDEAKRTLRAIVEMVR